MGTIKYPFKNIDPPFKEILNFMYSYENNVTIHIMRGTSVSQYYLKVPLLAFNSKHFLVTTYGDPADKKPRIYSRDNPYQWPDSSLFSLAEESYDFATREARGDISNGEATTTYLRFDVVRANVTLDSIEIQCISFGPHWQNILFMSFNNPFGKVVIKNAYLDLDGAFFESYSPVAFEIWDSHINVTNMEYGVWMDILYDCSADDAEKNYPAHLYLINNLFTEENE